MPQKSKGTKPSGKPRKSVVSTDHHAPAVPSGPVGERALRAAAAATTQSRATVMPDSVWAFIVAAVAVLVTSPTLRGGLRFDDQSVVGSPGAAPGAPLSFAWTRDYWGRPMVDPQSHQSWRPLSVLYIRMLRTLASPTGVGEPLRGAMHDAAVAGDRDGLTALALDILGENNVTRNDTPLRAAAEYFEPLSVEQLGSPSWYHAGSTALHVVACELLRRLLSKMLPGCEWATMATSLLFAVHPGHIEAVTSIAASCDLLCTCFALGAILKFVSRCEPGRYPPSRAVVLQCGALCCCASLSKEPGIMTFAILFAWDVFFANAAPAADAVRLLSCKASSHSLGHDRARAARRILRRQALLATFAALVVVARVVAANGQQPPPFARHQNPAAAHPSVLVRALTFAHYAARHAAILAWPLPPTGLAHDWSFDAVPLVQSLYDVRNAGSLVMLAVLAHLIGRVQRESQAFARRSDRLREGPGNPDESDVIHRSEVQLACDPVGARVLGLSVLVLMFLPASNLLVPVGFAVAERILYLPCAGFCLISGSFLCRPFNELHSARVTDLLHQRSAKGPPGGDSRSVNRWIARAAKAGTIVLLSLCVVTTAQRCEEWTTDEALSAAGVRTAPTNAKMWQYRALHHLDQGYDHLTDHELAVANSLWYDFTDVRFALANNIILNQTGGGPTAPMPEKAKELLESIADLSDRFCDGDRTKATTFGSTFFRLYEAERREQNEEWAARRLDQATAYLAREPSGLRDMVLHLLNLDRTSEGDALIVEYLLRYPMDAAVVAAAGASAASNRQLAQSHRWLLHALRLQPTNADWHFYLANLVTAACEIDPSAVRVPDASACVDEAVTWLQTALMINKFHTGAQARLARLLGSHRQESGTAGTEESCDSHFARGHRAWEDGRLKEAEREFEACSSVQEVDTLAISVHNSALVQLRRGRGKAALSTLRRGLLKVAERGGKGQPEAILHYGIAQVSAATGDLEGATEACRTAGTGVCSLQDVLAAAHQYGEQTAAEDERTPQ